MIFVRKTEVLELQDRLIGAFGGAPGLLNEAALESALVAAQNRHWYEGADVVGCAAAYAFHLTQAHAFVDGNKRIAAAVMEVFLVANEAPLEATDDEIFELIMSVAASRTERAEIEDWLRARVHLP